MTSCGESQPAWDFREENIRKQPISGEQCLNRVIEQSWESSPSIRLDTFPFSGVAFAWGCDVCLEEAAR